MADGDAKSPSEFDIWWEHYDTKWNLIINPVGSLQELCTARGCSYPFYTFLDDNEYESQTRYTAECSISSYKVSGKGKNKKAAKQQAAKLMLKIISQLSENDIKYNCSRENGPQSTTENMPTKPTSDKPFLKCEESVTELNMFFEKKRHNDTIAKYLNKNDKNSNKSMLSALVVLNYIGQIEGFTTKHFTIFPKHENEPVEVLMQLNTIPTFVFLGKGKDQHSGIEDAALNTLVFMIPETKKET